MSEEKSQKNASLKETFNAQALIGQSETAQSFGRFSESENAEDGQKSEDTMDQQQLDERAHDDAQFSSKDSEDIKSMDSDQSVNREKEHANAAASRNQPNSTAKTPVPRTQRRK